MSNPFGDGSSVVNGGGTATGGPIVQTIAGQPLAPGVVTRPGVVGTTAPPPPKPVVETNTPAPVAPTPPTVTPPAVMPSPTMAAPEVKKAGDVAVAAINARAGRASSILTNRRVSTLLTNNANAKAARPVFSPGADLYSRKTLG